MIGAAVVNGWSDGSCARDGNGGPGAWAAILVVDGEETILSGCAARTTSLRMEMLGALATIKAKWTAIIDQFGGQVAELTTLGAGFGADQPPADADATVLRSGVVNVPGLRSGEARCARLFGPYSQPGATLAFTAVGETTVIVAAPGGRVIDGDAPASTSRSSTCRVGSARTSSPSTGQSWRQVSSAAWTGSSPAP